MAKLGVALWAAVAVLMAPALVAAVHHRDEPARTIPPLHLVREAADPSEGAERAVWFAQAAYSDQQARERTEASARAQRASRSQRARSVPAGDRLARIAACESGGNPAAVSAGGRYRGMYQFSRATWASVGGEGDPAAASVEEQTYRAGLLLARSGAGQWPVCGRR